MLGALVELDQHRRLSIIPSHWFVKGRQFEQGKDYGGREVGPCLDRHAPRVKVAIEETLPTTETVYCLLNTQRSIVNCVGELVEVQHSIMATVHGHHHVDVQVTKDESLLMLFD